MLVNQRLYVIEVQRWLYSISTWLVLLWIFWFLLYNQHKAIFHTKNTHISETVKNTWRKTKWKICNDEENVETGMPSNENYLIDIILKQIRDDLQNDFLRVYYLNGPLSVFWILAAIFYFFDLHVLLQHLLCGKPN